MNLSEEIIKAFIQVVAMIASSLGSGAIVAVIILWADNRSNKKALRAVFTKVRALEMKVYGHESSESDGK